MNRYQPYRSIREKLEQANGTDTDALWSDMKAVLDREMPEKDRKGFLWWKNHLKTLITAGSIIAICICFFMLNHATKPEFDPVTGKIKVPVQNPSAQGPLLQRNSSQGARTVEEKDKMQPGQRTAPEQGSKSHNNIVTSANAPTVPANEMQPGNQVSTNPSAVPVSNEKHVLTIKEVGAANKFSDPSLQAKPYTVKTAINRIKKQDQASNTTSNGQQERQVPEIISQGTEKNIVLNQAFESKKVFVNNSNRVWPVNSSLYRSKIDPLPSLLSGSIKRTQADPTGNQPVIAEQPKVKVPVMQRIGFVAGASLNLNLPVSNQEMTTASVNGSTVSLIDYLPSVYVQYHFRNKLFVQSELQFSAPQYTPNFLLARQHTYQNQNKMNEQSLELKKLYYLNLPLSVHYSPVRNLYVGLGVQYGYLHKTMYMQEAAVMERQAGTWNKSSSTKSITTGKPKKAKKIKENNSNGNGNRPPVPMALADTVSTTFRTSDWRVFADVNYRWNRLNAGLRFNKGLTPYINTQSGNNVMQVKDQNESFQLYLRYDILDLRRKKR
jgi:hypothetical protein